MYDPKATGAERRILDNQLTIMAALRYTAMCEGWNGVVGPLEEAINETKDYLHEACRRASLPRSGKGE